MTDFFAAMQWDVIATDINGPFTPLPKGLSWFGNDNDYLLAHADFVIVAVGAHPLVVLAAQTHILPDSKEIVYSHSARWAVLGARNAHQHY